MRFFPFQRYIVTTWLSPEEILQRLLNSIDPERPFVGLDNYQFTAPYWGNAKIDSFFIMKNGYNRDSSRPAAWGEVKRDGSITRLSIVMSWHPFVTVFMIAWLGIISFIICTTIQPSTNFENYPYGFLFLPFLGLLFYFWFLNMFQSKAKELAEELTKLLDGKIVG